MVLSEFSTVRTGTVALHSHGVFEFHYITAGTGTYTVGSRHIPIRAGIFIISAPGEGHHIDAKNGFIHQIMFRADIDAHDAAYDDIRAMARAHVIPVGEREAFFFEQLRVLSESGRQYLVKSAAHRFLAFLYERSARAAVQSVPDPVSRCLDEIHRTLAASFVLCDTAKRIGVSAEYLIRAFKARTGQTPVQYRMRIKIDTAKLYLLRSERSIGDIASLSGFEDELYFSRMFRKHTGMPPSAYRSRLRPKVT